MNPLGIGIRANRVVPAHIKALKNVGRPLITPMKGLHGPVRQSPVRAMPIENVNTMSGGPIGPAYGPTYTGVRQTPIRNITPQAQANAIGARQKGIWSNFNKKYGREPIPLSTPAASPIPLMTPTSGIRDVGWSGPLRQSGGMASGVGSSIMSAIGGRALAGGALGAWTGSDQGTGGMLAGAAAGALLGGAGWNRAQGLISKTGLNAPWQRFAMGAGGVYLGSSMASGIFGR